MSSQTTPGGNLYFTTTDELTDPTADRQRAINRDARDREVKAVANDAVTTAGEALGTLGRVEAKTDVAVDASQTASRSALGAHQTADSLIPRVQNIETMAGLAPGEVTDAQTASLISEPATATRNALDATFMQVADVRRIVASIDPDEPLEDGDLLIVLRSRWFTDFREYSIGSPPRDWTFRWADGDPNTFEVIEDSTGTGGVVLRDQGADRYTRALTWDAVGQVQDAEIVFKWRARNISAPIRGLLRATQDRANRRGYYGGARQSDLNYIEVTTGTNSSRLVEEDRTFSADTWYITRLRAEGTQFTVKTWDADTPEPAEWDLTTTDTTHETGHVGFFVYHATLDRRIDWIGVSIDGSPAPMEAV